MSLLDFRVSAGAEPGSASKCSNASQLLLVDVQQARSLKNIALIGTIDPFVVLFAVGKDSETQIGRTAVKTDTLNPQWNESFICTIPRDVTVLRARVMGGSSKHIGTLDFDLTANAQSFESTVGWFPLESQRGEVRIGWRTFPLGELLQLPTQLDEARASHAAEVRRLEVAVAEAEGRAQAATKRAEALQSESSSGTSALEAISADHSKAQEQNLSLAQQVAHKDAEIAQLRRELEEQKENTMSAKARKAFAQVSESMDRAVEAVRSGEAYEASKQAIISGAAQAKEMASSGVGMVKGMFAKKESATSPTSESK